MTDDRIEDFAFSLQAAFEYTVFIEGGSIYNTGRSLSDIYAYLQLYLRDGQSVSNRVIYTSTGSAIVQLAAEEYIKAVSTYSATKTAPFGTLAGSTFFGAQGVWLQGMATADEEHRYRYASRNGTSTSPVFTLPAVSEAGSVTTTLLSTTANRNWDGTAATADSYETNRLVVLYTTSDTFFVPYIDTIEDVGNDTTPGTVTQSLTYVQDREIVIEVRNVQATPTQIVPFKTTGTITSSGLTQSIIRTEDTVFT